MTSITFYFNADDRFEVACRLAAKAHAQRKRLVIYAAEADAARRIDRLLWAWQPLSFVPHCMAGDPLAPQTPVLISTQTAVPGESAAACELMLNLSPECPPSFERYARLLEVVGHGDEERSAGRDRYRFYKERGYAIENHDLAARKSAH